MAGTAGWQALQGLVLALCTEFFCWGDSHKECKTVVMWFKANILHGNAEDLARRHVDASTHTPLPHGRWPR